MDQRTADAMDQWIQRENPALEERVEPGLATPGSLNRPEPADYEQAVERRDR